jgi:hypothetical protein
MGERCEACGQPLPTSGKVLTPHELDALSAWWHTGSVKGASDMLGLTERTITNQLYSARARYGFHKTTELVQLHFGQLRTRDDLIRSHNQRRAAA